MILVMQLHTSDRKLIFICRSSTAKLYKKRVFAPYEIGYWYGTEVSDIVRFGIGLNTSIRARFSLITYSKQFFVQDCAWQGILGMAFYIAAMVRYTIHFAGSYNWVNV